MHQAIPDGLPVTVRATSVVRHVLAHKRSEMVLAVLFALLIIPFAVYLVENPDQNLHSPRYGDIDSHLLAYVAVLLGVGVLLAPPVTAWRQLRRPVIVAADGAGLYLRPNLDQQVLRLPWNRIEDISVRRWHGPQLCAKPSEPWVEELFELEAGSRRSGRRMGVAIAQRRRIKRLGTNIHTPIGAAEQTPEQILTALRDQVAGRCPVQV